MSPIQLYYAPRNEFDTGRFIARYLQLLAVADIALMIICPFINRGFNLDFSFIFFFWAASALKRHSNSARKWVIAVSSLALVVTIIIAMDAIFFGTGQITISVVRSVHNPALWQVLVVSLACAILGGIPIVILLSPTARRQFSPPIHGDGISDDAV